MSATLEDLTNDFLSSYFSLFPTQASRVGWPGHDHQLPDLSPENIENHCRDWRRIQTAVDQLEISHKETRIDAQLLKNLIARNLFALEVERHHLTNPAATMATVADSLWELMRGRHRSDAEKVDALMARLKLIPSFLQHSHNLQSCPITLWIQIALEEAPGVIHYLTDGVLPYLEKQRVAGCSTLIELASHSIDETIRHLKNLSKTQSTFAIGREHFESLLQNFHGIERSAAAILKEGFKQIEIISKQLIEHAHQIDPAKSWQELVKLYKQKHPAADNLLTAYRSKVAEIKQFLRDHDLVTLPEHESLDIIETPEFLQSSIPYAAYSDPPMFADDDQGTFFVSPTHGNEEVLQEHCYAAFPLTALHEAYPGHHLQFSMQRQLKSPIRKVYDVASYYEGWTLYCEEMMYREGFYDEAMRLYQLKDRLWRAARIVVDIQMQCHDMSDAQAVKFLVDQAKLSPHGARVDVNWYTQSPTIPMSYLIGMLEVDRLREDYMNQGHSLRQFHDAFLQCGAIPLKYVAQLI